MIAFLIVLAAALLIRAWWLRSDPVSMAAIKPYDGRMTEQAVCSVTLSLTGVESEAAVRLFASVCEGMNVKPCIFVTTNWLDDHADLYQTLSFAEWGMLLEREPAGRTRKKVMANLAAENERFLSLAGTFPRYVRLKNGEPGDLLSAALQAYGQLCVGSRGDLTGTPLPGGIADCGLLNGTTGYALAKYCAAVMAEEYEIIPLSELQKQA